MNRCGSKNKGPANGRFIVRGPESEKRCSKCGQYRPLDEFSRDRSRYDGRAYVCKLCRSHRVSPGPTNFERRAKRKEGLSWCRRCSDWLSLLNVRGGLCRRCANREMRERYSKNPEFRFRRQKRSSARRRGVDPIPATAREMLFEEFNGSCAYCDRPANTFDHVVPVARGGLSEPANVVPCCTQCNSSKRTQDVWSWLQRQNRTPKYELVERLCLADISLCPPVGPTAI